MGGTGRESLDLLIRAANGDPNVYGNERTLMADQAVAPEDLEVRPTLRLSDEEKQRLEKEKQALLAGIAIPRGPDLTTPRARRLGARPDGMPEDYEPPLVDLGDASASAVADEVAAGRAPVRQLRAAAAGVSAPVLGVEEAIRLVKQRQAELKDAQRALRKALKKIGL